MNAITSLQRWQGDDWVIPCTVEDPAGGAINLTGKTVVGELWLAGYRFSQPLTLANGGILRSPQMSLAGQFTAIAPRLLTAQAPGDAGIPNPSQRTRILLAMFDANGHRQTFGPVPFQVFDGSEDLAIDDVQPFRIVYQSTSLRLVVAATQGPDGPSQIGVGQLTDAGDMGRQLAQAADAAAALALLGMAAPKRAPVDDVNYAVKLTDTYVAFTSLTAPRTVTLPSAAAYPLGVGLHVADESMACSDDRPITIAAAGDDSILGAQLVTMKNPGKLVFHSNGSNLWTV